MSALFLSDAWGESGLDRLRPDTADRALRTWLEFGVFGTAHWPRDRNREDPRDPARPLVPGCPAAKDTARWGRAAYEQQAFYWTLLALTAAGWHAIALIS